MSPWLPPLPDPAQNCCILDTTFGDGVCFLNLWHHWLSNPQNTGLLNVIGLHDSLESDALREISSNLPAHLAPLASQLLAQWPLPVPGLHRLLLDNGRITLTLALSSPGQPSPLESLVAVCDVLWIPHSTTSPLPNAAHLARLCRPGTALYSNAKDPSAVAAFERSLTGAGFAVQSHPNETARLTATFRAAHSRVTFYQQPPRTRAALIIGAGLAGSSAALSLAKRGWEVTVLERHALPAQGASGNLAGVLSPMLSKDDGFAARLARASFLHLLAELRDLESTQKPGLWDPCGKLQLARTPKEEALFQEIVERHAYPEKYVRYLSREEAAQDLGHAVHAGGWLFPEGGWVNPAALCEARLHATSNVVIRTNCGVLEITYGDQRWTAKDADGNVVGSAPVLVLANAFEAAHFAPTRSLHFKKVRGQVTHLPPESLPPLKRVLSRDGYLTPSINGVCSLGATYDFDDDRTDADIASHQANIARLPELLAGFTPSLAPDSLRGRVGFRSLTADRLPMIGALPDFAKASGAETLLRIPRLPGLYAVLGLGSRGLLWSGLSGEILAAMLTGEPAPLSGELLNAVDPARFLLRQKTKGFPLL